MPANFHLTTGVVYARAWTGVLQGANLLQTAGSYLNFGSTSGDGGYGFRDNSGTMQWKNSGGAWANITAGAPGGSNTQVQFNNAGAFGGDSDMTFSGDTLTVTKVIAPTSIVVGTSETPVTTGAILQVYKAGAAQMLLRDTTNDVEWSAQADSSAAYIGTQTNHQMLFFTNTANRWAMQAAGHFVAATDNTYDIGASGATRPRTGYFGTSVVSPTFQTTTALVTSVDGGATAAFTANMVGGTGAPTTAAQNGWVKATDSTGATVWIPVWK